MQLFKRAALRLAVLIHARYRTAQRKPPLYFPESIFDKSLRLRRLVERADFHGWQLAASRLRCQLAAELDFCRMRMEELRERLREEPAPVPSLVDLWHEILALDREFPNVNLDVRARRLSVVTHPVTLKNIELGRFSIKLDCKSLPDADYSVVALEPNPARSNPVVTHPHVRSEELCEGEGREALHAATQNGRLFDFFQIVSQLLHTYGEGSAYVELDVWKSAHCNGCGDWTVDGGQNCNGCDVPLCERCLRSCFACGEPYCSPCLSSCDYCQEAFCDGCMTTCDSCRTENLCEKCNDHRYDHPQKDEENDEELDGTSAHAEVQPDGLGQAALSA